MFWPDRIGGDGNIITQASVSDGEDKTEDREGKGEQCSAGRGERHSGEVRTAAES